MRAFLPDQHLPFFLLLLFWSDVRLACSLVVYRSTALGSALLAGSAIGLFGWDVTKPETLAKVNVHGSTTFSPQIEEKERARMWQGWQKAVERSKGWDIGGDNE